MGKYCTDCGNWIYEGQKCDNCTDQQDDRTYFPEREKEIIITNKIKSGKKDLKEWKNWWTEYNI